MIIADDEDTARKNQHRTMATVQSKEMKTVFASKLTTKPEDIAGSCFAYSDSDKTRVV